MLQDAPRWAQDAPKMTPRCPKRLPRWAQNAPRGSQDGPKRPQDAPRLRKLYRAEPHAHTCRRHMTFHRERGGTGAQGAGRSGSAEGGAGRKRSGRGERTRRGRPNGSSQTRSSPICLYMYTISYVCMYVCMYVYRIYVRDVYTSTTIIKRGKPNREPKLQAKPAWPVMLVPVILVPVGVYVLRRKTVHGRAACPHIRNMQEH